MLDQTPSPPPTGSGVPGLPGVRALGEGLGECGGQREDDRAAGRPGRPSDGRDDRPPVVGRGSPPGSTVGASERLARAHRPAQRRPVRDGGSVPETWRGAEGPSGALQAPISGRPGAVPGGRFLAHGAQRTASRGADGTSRGSARQGRARVAAHVRRAPGDAGRVSEGDSGADAARGSGDDAAVHAPSPAARESAVRLLDEPNIGAREETCWRRPVSRPKPARSRRRKGPEVRDFQAPRFGGGGGNRTHRLVRHPSRDRPDLAIAATPRRTGGSRGRGGPVRPSPRPRAPMPCRDKRSDPPGLAPRPRTAARSPPRSSPAPSGFR